VACSTHGRNLKGRDHLENLDVVGKILLEGILGIKGW